VRPRLNDVHLSSVSYPDDSRLFRSDLGTLIRVPVLSE
jgi:hypothetical protein